MSRHLSANLWLLVLTLLLCSVAYPAVLWGVGQTVFRSKADGSMLKKGQVVVGSRLIAQPFSKDEYFQPRPSAASYNAAASSGSNWGASNPLLRDRVARQLGPMVTYRDGKRVGPEVQDWFVEAPDRLAQWADSYSQLAANWINQDKASKEFVQQWSASHADAPEYQAWRTENPEKQAPEPGDLAGPFFASYARENPRTWLTLDDKDDQGKPLKDKDDNAIKRVKPVAVKKVEKDEDENSEVQGYLFDFWLQQHADKAAELKPVPADMVMTSGSGLDPHITLKNAEHQLDRVAGKWAEKTKADVTTVRDRIKQLLEEKKEAPLGGLVGVPLVNVLEMNLALDDQIPRLAATR
jgi:potassium-transporting ATPase KdpC subunit